MAPVRSCKLFNKPVSIAISFIVVVSGFFLFIPETVDAAPSTELVDAGIDYTDGIEKAATEDPNTGKTVYVDALHMNPYRGIHTWAADLKLKNSDDSDANKAVEPYLAATMKERSLGYFAVDISDFSGAYHLTDDGGRGPDAELTESALAAIDQSLKNFKKNNMQVIIRFVYDKDNNGLEDGEGCVIPDKEVVVPDNWKNYNRVVEARQDMIMRHIEQLSQVLKDNREAIYTVQIGFYGETGECHSTGACYDGYIAEALDKFLQETHGSELRISTRTPRRYAYYRFGIADINRFANDVTAEVEDAYRAAIFNDGYLGTGNDWGTFENREKETDWMATQNLHNPYGGDAIPAPGGIVGDPAKPPAVLNEMFKVHTSYISPDYRLVNYWKDVEYDEDEHDYAKMDPEYAGRDLYSYIENHLGYRFVLRDSRLSGSVKAGGTLRSEFSIENVGFGNLFYPMKSYAYITDEYGKVVAGPTQVDVDPTSFGIDAKASDSMDIPVPADMEPGEYDLYLQFRIGDREVDGVTKPYGAIRFANRDIWNEGLEANYLGSFKVDREIKIIKKWDDRSNTAARPNALTFTIEKTRLPFEYQEVEYIEADGTQWIDTDVPSDAGHTIHSEGSAYEGKVSCLLQSVTSDGRLGVKLYGGTSKKASYFWRIGSSGPSNTDISSVDLNGIVVTEGLQMTQNATGLVIKQDNLTKTASYQGAASGTTGGNWMIFKSNENESYGILYEAKIIDSSGIIHHYIPCYRKSDNEIGVYDVVAGTFLKNSGTGTFKKGDDVSYDGSEEVTIPKEKWTVDGDVWETTVSTEYLSVPLLIHEADVAHYNSDADADHKKTIPAHENEVTITNTLSDTDHTWNTGEVIKKPSYTAAGEMKYTCRGCGATKTAAIAKLEYPAGKNPNQKGAGGSAVAKGASAAAAEAAITKATGDEGPAGSRYMPLALKSVKQTKNSIKLTWNGVKKGKRYVVYGNTCGKKNKMKRLGETGSRSFNVKKIGASLKKGKYHKFMVVALDKNRNVVTTSKVVHIATKGGKVKNPTKVTVKGSVIKKARKLKVGKSLKLKAVQKGSKVKRHRKICYESTNTAVAKVSAIGKIKARKKGTCYVYAYAQNGIARKIKVVVK